jgi:chromosome segregation ATPase
MSVEERKQLILDEIQKTHHECAGTRDRIEHLIERVAALERKINALAEAEQTRRDKIIDRIQALLELHGQTTGGVHDIGTDDSASTDQEAGC